MNEDTKRFRTIVQRLLEKGSLPTKLIQDFVEAEGIKMSNFPRAMRQAGAVSRARKSWPTVFEWYIENESTKNSLDKSDIFGYDEIEEKEPTP